MRTIKLPKDSDAELVFEACVELEFSLRTEYAKKVSFLHGLVVRRDDGIPKVREEITLIEEKLQRIHKIKYLFGTTYESIDEVNTSAL